MMRGIGCSDASVNKRGYRGPPLSRQTVSWIADHPSLTRPANTAPVTIIGHRHQTVFFGTDTLHRKVLVINKVVRRKTDATHSGSPDGSTKRPKAGLSARRQVGSGTSAPTPPTSRIHSLGEQGPKITPAEIDEIEGCCAWQLGETSDGSHHAQSHANTPTTIGDADFVEMIDCFIAEEQRHGATLGRYLYACGVARARKELGRLDVSLLPPLPGQHGATFTIPVVIVPARPGLPTTRSGWRRACLALAQDLRTTAERRGAAHPHAVRARRHPCTAITAGMCCADSHCYYSEPFS